jgi:hypothetical protein
VHQDGFDMVVKGVPHHHGLSIDGFGNIGQEIVAHFARRLFQREALAPLVGFYVALFHGGWQTQPLRQAGNITGIGVRFVTAQLVIEMGNV